MADNQSQIAGLFMTPEMYQQQQQQQAMENARAVSQMTPGQKASYFTNYGGQMFGQGLAQALGAQDPMLQRQAVRTNILKSINPSDPKSWQQAIMTANQQGDGELSSYLLGKYKETAQVAKEQSIADKNAAWEAAKTDSEKKRNVLSSVEQDLVDGKEVDPKMLNQAKLILAQETKPKMFQQADGTIVQVPGIDVNLFPNIGKAIGKTGAVAGSSGTGVAGAVETPASVETKRKEVQAAEGTIKSIDNSLDTLSKLQDLRKERDWTTNPWVADTMSKFPTQARTQQNLVKSQIADKVIGVIGEMKQQSKTGATGFGALNMAELDKLESTVRKLDPLDPNFDNDIKEVVNKLNSNKANIQKELQYRQEKLNTATGKQSSMSGKNPQIKDTEGAWLEKAMKLNPNYTRAQAIKKGIEAGKLSAGYQ